MANLATINNNLLADSGIDPLSVVLGSGTANQIAYWIDADNIGALTTATYPSLTELSYVKGVTSAIQTQLNGKQATLSLTTTGTSGAATLVGATLNIPQYQAALTNPVTGTGTTNYIPKFTSSSAIGNSLIYDNGSAIGINTSLSGINTLSLLNIKAAVSDGNQIYIIQENDDRGWRLRTTNSGHFYLESSYQGSSTDQFAIRYDTGRTTIGTTSADEKLTVGGAIKSLSNANDFAVQGTIMDYLDGTPGTGRINAYKSTGAILSFYTNENGGSATERVRINSGGTIRFNAYTTNGLLKTSASDGTIAIATAGTDYQAPITLTTTGTSGAATFSSNTLNIPQYQSVLTNPVTGTGTANTITKWTSSSAVGNSSITDNGSLVSTALTVSVGNSSLGTTGIVILRGRLCFSNSYESNHSIYNNILNIDGEGSFDGMKMNVYNGLDVRTGDAASATPTTMLTVRTQGVGINRTGAANAVLDVVYKDASTNIIRVSSGTGNGAYRWRIDQSYDMHMTNASSVETFSVINSSGNISTTGVFNINAQRISEVTNLYNAQTSLLLQSSTTNARTWFTIAPNGTSTLADIVISHLSDYVTNYETLQLGYFGGNSTDFYAISTSSGGTGTQRALLLSASSASAYPNGNQLFLNTNGKIGVGTRVPTSILSVAATSDVNDLGSTGLTIGGATTLTSGNVLMLNFTPIGASSNRARAGIGCVVGSDWGKGNLTFYTKDASSGVAMTTSDERMRITSSGLVGIATNIPGSLLTVYEGDIRLWKTHVYNQSATWKQNILFTDEADRVGAKIVGLRTEWDGAPMALAFETGAVNTTVERMRIGSASTRYDIMIGNTTNPYSADNRGSIFLNGTSASLYGWGIGGVGKGYMYHDGTNVYLENSNSGGFFALYQVGAGYFTFNTNASERMRITSGGLVGINTASPGSLLTVYEGDIRLWKTHVYNQSATWKQNILFTDEVDRVGAKIVGQREAWDGAPMGLQFETGAVNSTTARLKITSGGNTIVNPVGGNASYTEALLTVKASATDGNQIHIVQSNDDRGWRFRAKTDGHFYLQSTHLGSDTERLKIQFDTGKVSINTTSSIGMLTVNNNTFSGGNGVFSDSRVGYMLNGSLTSYVYASTYNDPTYPDYGFVFIHGANTSSYNVWSISPDGPARGSALNFIYGSNATNIHSTAPKVVFNGSSGEVWIGYTSDQGSYLLQVNGSTYSASGFFESSDIRLKTILNRHQSVDFDAIEYNWNDGRDSKLHWGYAAQEVMKILPDAVNGSEELFYTLDYNQVHTYKIAMLEKRIAELESQLKNK